MLKAVIFDMDGVLVDSEPLHYEVNKLTMERYFEKPLPYDYYKQFIGSTVMYMWEKIIKDFSIEGYSVEQLFELSEVIKDEIVNEKGYPPVNGAYDFVKSLTGKYKLAVASSSSMINIKKNVVNLGISECFDTLVSGIGLRAPKPAPDIFLKAAEELKVLPNECIVIEDSCNGTRAAKAAGMACLGFINKHSGEQNLEAADYLFEEFGNIDYNFLEMVYSHHFGEPWKVLETDRLIIREMCPKDTEDIYKIYDGNDLTYMENLYEDMEKERAYIADYQKYIYNFYDFGIWLFQLKDTGEIIGRGGVEHKIYEDESEAIEMGYIIKKSYQRKGFAYEGLSAILSYVKEYFDIKEVCIRIDKENIASLNLAKKLGFTFKAGEEDMSEKNKEIILVKHL